MSASSMHNIVPLYNCIHVAVHIYSEIVIFLNFIFSKKIGKIC